MLPVLSANIAASSITGEVCPHRWKAVEVEGSQESEQRRSTEHRAQHGDPVYQSQTFLAVLRADSRCECTRCKGRRGRGGGIGLNSELAPREGCAQYQESNACTVVCVSLEQGPAEQSSGTMPQLAAFDWSQLHRRRHIAGCPLRRGATGDVINECDANAGVVWKPRSQACSCRVVQPHVQQTKVRRTRTSIRGMERSTQLDQMPVPPRRGSGCVSICKPTLVVGRYLSVMSLRKLCSLRRNSVSWSRHV